MNKIKQELHYLIGSFYRLDSCVKAYSGNNSAINILNYLKFFGYGGVVIDDDCVDIFDDFSIIYTIERDNNLKWALDTSSIEYIDYDMNIWNMSIDEYVKEVQTNETL